MFLKGFMFLKVDSVKNTASQKVHRNSPCTEIQLEGSKFRVYTGATPQKLWHNETRTKFTSRILRHPETKT